MVWSFSMPTLRIAITKIRTSYQGRAELFGVWCPELDTVYLVPVKSVPGGTDAHLRVSPTKNNQETGIRWAKDYECVAQFGSAPL